MPGRDDEKRMDWLEARRAEHAGRVWTMAIRKEHETVRAAIDAAMDREEQDAGE